jgi:hypothetical protein
MKEHSSFTGANIESSFHEQSLTTASRPAGWFLKILKIEKAEFAAVGFVSLRVLG